jgi:hypothetical protein
VTADEALLTIAEIAIATIGFAGIVSALRPKSSHVSDSMHRLRLRLMIEGSASVMVYAFLPFVLAGAFPEQQTWAIGSGILAVTSPIHVGSIYRRQRRLFGSALIRETLLFDTSVIIMAVGVEAVLILNCLGVLFQPIFSGYLLGVLLPLGVAVAMFVRAIFASDTQVVDQNRTGK